MTLKKYVSVLLSLFFALLLLQDCKHDPPIGKNPGNDPDSLYVGTPYVYPQPRHILYPYRKFSYPSGYTMTKEGIQLGRMLFYDSTLSRRSAMPRISCATCHKQQYAFGDNVAFSRNVDGPNKRNALPLINMSMDSTYFWDSRKATVEDAVKDALDGELHPDLGFTLAYIDSNPKYIALFKKAFGRPLTINEDNVVNAIAQFVRTLNSTDSRIDRYFRGDPGSQLTAEEDSGLAIFLDPATGDCTHCHSDGPFLTFSNQIRKFANNALDSVSSVYEFTDRGVGAINGNPNDFGKFKIPTLRNVEVSGPYMHDARFTTLDQVIDHYTEGLKPSPNIDPGAMQHINTRGFYLTQTQKGYLVSFLKALTDTSYIHNPDFSNPFH